MRNRVTKQDMTRRLRRLSLLFALLILPMGTRAQDGNSLSEPTMSIYKGQSNEYRLSLNYDGQDQYTMYYSINYVSDALEDVTKEEYVSESQPEILGPCTVTAYVEAGGVSGPTATGKFFGFAQGNNVTAVSGSAIQLTIVPSLPDAITYKYYSYDESIGESIVVPSQNNTVLTAGIVGETTVSAQLLLDGWKNDDFTILNGDGMVDEIQVTVLPPAPTVSVAGGTYDRAQSVTLSSDYVTNNPNTASIKYYLGDYVPESIPTYTEALSIEESTKLTAWVEAHDATGAPYESEKVVVNYVIRQKPYLEFVNPNYVANVVVMTEATASVGMGFTSAIPGLSNPEKLAVTYESSVPTVATVDQEGNVEILAAGTTKISAVFAGNDVYQPATVRYMLTVDYGISVDGTAITVDNMSDVFNDGKVSYNGKGTLILNGYSDQTASIVSSLDELVIYLKGENAVMNVVGQPAGQTSSLVFDTNPLNPGSLTLAYADGAVTSGFTSVTLASSSGLIWQEGSATASSALLRATIPVIADKDDEEVTVTPTSDDVTPGSTELVEEQPEDDADQTMVMNKLSDNILYTLVVKDAAGNTVETFGNDGKGIFLKTYVSEADMAEALLLGPGSPEFARKFNGVTFKLAGGSGVITLTVDVPEHSKLMVKIGSETAKEFSGVTGIIEIPYVCDEATYVYIYNGTPASASARGLGRAKVLTAPIRTGAVGVKASSVQKSPDPADQAHDNPLLASEVSEASINGDGVYTPSTGDKLTALEEAVFNAIKDNLNVIDLRSTAITGVNVSRTSGPFLGVSQKTFIYMPAGNSNTGDEPNVIIGAVCNKLQLSSGDASFAPLMNFGVKQATLNRNYVADQTSTVYLPFAVSQAAADDLGAFYTFKGVTTAGEADLEPVTTGGLAANTPYIFKKSSGGAVTVANVSVIMGTPVTSELIGTYTPITWTSAMLAEKAAAGKYIYGFAANAEGSNIQAGEFVRVGEGATIKPYRAYLELTQNYGARLSINWGDDETTSIMENGKLIIENKADAWYTLDGRRLSAAPTKPGLYLHNGKKVTIHQTSRR